MATCIFCDILAGRAPASVVYQDDVCWAFMDLHQVNAGHVLVVPKLHAATLADLDDATGGHLFNVGRRIAAALRQSGLRCEGVNRFLADGAAAGQSVAHIHVHVIPRYLGDGAGFRLGSGQHTWPERAELDALAERISAQL
jgi:histidine triad (HIT) family protein